MVLNPDKTKALVVSRSRTANRLHGDLIMSEVSIFACLNLDILGVKFDSWLTVEDHVRGIVSRVCQRIGILRLVDLSCFVATMHLFSQSLSIALRCGGLLRNVIFSFSSSRFIRLKSFALIRLYCRCVIEVILLHCVGVQVNSNSNHCLFHLLLSEYDITELRLQLIH